MLSTDIEQRSPLGKIANGRVLGDPNGKFTCHKYNGSSVIDYVLVGSSVLSEIRYLRVHDFVGYK